MSLSARSRSLCHITVSGAPLRDRSTQALVKWLALREEVVEVRPRRSDALEVRYRELPDQDGLFMMSLQDELFSLSRPTPAPALQATLAHWLPGRARIRIAGASDSQIGRIAAWLETMNGVARVSPSEASDSILILFDRKKTSAQKIIDAVNASVPGEWPCAPAHEHRKWPKVAFSAVVLGVTLAGVAPPPVAAAAVAITAIDPARRALSALRKRRLTVDTLDVLAIGISLARSQPSTAALITCLLGIGDLLLERTSDHARAAIARLSNFEVAFAWRVRGEKIERVPARKLRPGDQIKIYAGDSVAADGVIMRGQGSVDEKALTGESEPRARGVGTRVLAASVLLEGQLVVGVDRAGSDTTAAKIVRILHDAGKKPMSLQHETERIANLAVLPTIALAAIAGFAAADIERTTSVLITDFGSGLRIAAPTSALAAMTVAAGEGLLIKGGQYLERLSKVDAVVFDKTGTLTLGAPEVFDVVGIDGWNGDDGLALAAAAEDRQRHPVAEAIREYARGRGVPSLKARGATHKIGHGVSARVDGHRVIVGGARMMRGVADLDDPEALAAAARHRSVGASSVFVAVDGRVATVVGYRDGAREESAEVVRALGVGGRREVIVMSGDTECAVLGLARSLGIRVAHHGLLPEQKVELVRDLQRRGRIVAMVGDGINDAPALAIADVGISLRGATDVAIETADVILVSGGLRKLPRAFDLADRAMHDVRRGLAIVIAPNALAIALGSLGMITPGVAAVVNNGSTIVAALAGLAPLLAPGARRRRERRMR